MIYSNTAIHGVPVQRLTCNIFTWNYLQTIKQNTSLFFYKLTQLNPKYNIPFSVYVFTGLLILYFLSPWKQLYC